VAEPDPTIPAEISNKFRRKTTVYSTKADKEVLAKLQSPDWIETVPDHPGGIPGLAARDRAQPHRLVKG
jgi:hypothetical protein